MYIPNICFDILHIVTEWGFQCTPAVDDYFIQIIFRFFSF